MGKEGEKNVEEREESGGSDRKMHLWGLALVV